MALIGMCYLVIGMGLLGLPIWGAITWRRWQERTCLVGQRGRGRPRRGSRGLRCWWRQHENGRRR